VSESIVPIQELVAEHWRDPRAGAGRNNQSGRSALSALGLPPDEEAALLEQVISEYEQRWLTTSSPPWTVAHRARPRQKAGAPSPKCTPYSTTSNGSPTPQVAA